MSTLTHPESESEFEPETMPLDKPGFVVWLVPSLPDAVGITIAKQAGVNPDLQPNSYPDFPPHVTLASRQPLRGLPYGEILNALKSAIKTTVLQPIVFDFKPSGSNAAEKGSEYIIVKLGSKSKEPFDFRRSFLRNLGVSDSSKFEPHISLAYIDRSVMKEEGVNYLDRLGDRIAVVNKSQVQLKYSGASHTSFTVGEVWIIRWSSIFDYHVYQRIIL